MEEAQNQLTLLEELNRRQDEVLAELDQLNGRLESLLKTLTPKSAVRAEPIAEAA